jgi:hypothetical protein
MGYDQRHRRRPRRPRRGLGRPHPASPGDHPSPGGPRRPGRGDRGRPGPRPLGDLEREPRGVGPLAIPPDPLSEEDRPRRPPHRHDRHLPRQPQRRPLPPPRRLDLPRQPRSWRKNPPKADGRKVVIVDTDHLWGIGGDAEWVRKVLSAGHRVAYMDPLDEDAGREGVRGEMGA